MKATFLGLVYWGSLLLLAGCSRGQAINTPEPETFPFVQCKVQMDGKDVEGAIVGFHAKDGKSPEIESHYDSENAAYRFITKEGSAKKAGVPAGEYAVTVKPGTRSKTRIPAKYAKPETSGLMAEVKPGQNFLPPFELTP